MIKTVDHIGDLLLPVPPVVGSFRVLDVIDLVKGSNKGFLELVLVTRCLVSGQAMPR